MIEGRQKRDGLVFIEMFCWARSTYWVPFNQEIPDDSGVREQRMVSYYQWTPFFLVICAFVFYSPCLIWRLLYDKSGTSICLDQRVFIFVGLRLKDIMSFANDRSNIQPGRAF